MDIPESVRTFVNSFTNAVINPLLALLFAGALFYFVVGLMKMIYGKNLSEPGKAGVNQIAEGKQHMIWGLIGMTIMVSVKALLWLVLNTFGMSAPSGLPL